MLLPALLIAAGADEADVNVIPVIREVANDADGHVASPRILEPTLELTTSRATTLCLAVENTLQIVVHENQLCPTASNESVEERPLGSDVELARGDRYKTADPTRTSTTVVGEIHVATTAMAPMASEKTATPTTDIVDAHSRHPRVPTVNFVESPAQRRDRLLRAPSLGPVSNDIGRMRRKLPTVLQSSAPGRADRV